MRRHKQRGYPKPLVSDHYLVRVDRYYDLSDQLVRTEETGGQMPYLGTSYNLRSEEIWYDTTSHRQDTSCDHYSRVIEHEARVSAVSAIHHREWWERVPSGPNMIDVLKGRIETEYHEDLGAPAGNGVPGINSFTASELYSLSLDSALNKHYDALRDSLGESMSLVNSIIELKEVAQMKGIFKRFKDLGEALSKSDKPVKFPLYDSSVDADYRPPPSQGPGILTDATLGYGYGFKPLVDDLGKLMNIAKTRRDMLEKVRRAAMEPVTIRSKTTVGIPGRSGSIGTRPDGRNYSTHKYTAWDVSVGEAEVWFVSKVLNDLRPYDNTLGEIPLFLKAMGISNPLAIAYEAIPLSFALDNVINVGRMINKLDLLDMLTRTRMVRATSHIKMTQTANCVVFGYPNTYVPAVWDQPCCWAMAKRYQRWVGLPPEPSFNFEAPTDIGKLYTDMFNAERLYELHVKPKINWLAAKLLT